MAEYLVLATRGGGEEEPPDDYDTNRTAGWCD